jgi:hypothetical protein
MDAFINALLAIRFPTPLRYALTTLLVAAVTGLRLLLAGTLEGYVSSWGIRSSIAQPTTGREKRSSTTARYSQPSRGQM